MMKQRIDELNSDQLCREIIVELDYMVSVPELNLGDRAKAGAISISANHIKKCLNEMLSNEIFLLERLRHSETERFR